MLVYWICLIISSLHKAENTGIYTRQSLTLVPLDNRIHFRKNKLSPDIIAMKIRLITHYAFFRLKKLIRNKAIIKMKLSTSILIKLFLLIYAAFILFIGTLSLSIILIIDTFFLIVSISSSVFYIFYLMTRSVIEQTNLDRYTYFLYCSWAWDSIFVNSIPI